jgi:exodeoxyribonuclease III
MRIATWNVNSLRARLPKLTWWIERARPDLQPGRYTWWDYRAGVFPRKLGMRIDHLLVTRPLADRLLFSEIDREARKGQLPSSDHAPLVVDLDAPGGAFDAGWSGAEARAAARRRA